MVLSRHDVARFVVFVVVTMTFLQSTSSITTEESGQEDRPEMSGGSKNSRGLFSPRMEYDEWTPLGRGDPLKNDPTYDYVPPVLERVHYWIEPSSRTPDPPAPTVAPASKELETSRLSQRRPSPGTENSSADSRRDVYDPFFMKFVDGSKFSTQHRNHQHYYHHYHLRRPSSTMSQQANSPSSIQRTHHYMPSYHSSYQHKIQQKQRPFDHVPDRHHLKPNQRITLDSPYSSSDHHAEKQHRPAFQTEIHDHQDEEEDEEKHKPRPPYTMLVPPPLQISNLFTSMSDAQKPVHMAELSKLTTQSPLIKIEHSNLIYHQSSTLPNPDWEEGKTQLATIAEASSQVTRKAPLPTKYEKYSSGRPYTTSTVLGLQNKPSLIYSPNVEVLPSTELQFSDNNNINYPVKNNTSSQWSTNMMMTTVQPTTVAITTASSLTTDPLFSHYKQPVEPLRGPMYLIIQGHSKVKTYGANKNQNSFHGIPLQENNDINQQGNEDNKNDRIGKALEDYPLLEDIRETNDETRVTNSSFLQTEDSLVTNEAFVRDNNKVDGNYMDVAENISPDSKK